MTEPPGPKPVPSPAPGSRPEGAQNEREAASYVRQMFSRIAPRYDLLNHLLSFNLDKLWRRRTARRFRHILSRPDARVLDLCCGTGDLALALWKQGSEGDERSAGGEGRGEVEIWGSDFAHPMLTRAREKAAELRCSGARAGRRIPETGNLEPAIRFVEADAMRLPFPDASFDLVTAAFGFRNLANYEAGLREIHRVLKPGGEVGILEFAAPRNRVLGALYRMYFTQVLPRVGGAVSGSRAAYSYLPASVMKFPEPEQLRSEMLRLGFADAQTELWTLGTVALHLARVNPSH